MRFTSLLFNGKQQRARFFSLALQLSLVELCFSLTLSARTLEIEFANSLSLSLCAVCKLGENLYHCGERCRRLTPTGTTWTALYDSTLCLLESSYAHPHERWKRHLSVGVQRTRTRRAPCALHTLLGAGAKTAGSLFAQELRHIR